MREKIISKLDLSRGVGEQKKRHRERISTLAYAHSIYNTFEVLALMPQEGARLALTTVLSSVPNSVISPNRDRLPQDTTLFATITEGVCRIARRAQRRGPEQSVMPSVVLRSLANQGAAKDSDARTLKKLR
jgi:hypothetical protein